MHEDDAPWATIPELLDAISVGRRGELEAVVDGDERITFTELVARARRLAGALHGMGLGPGSRLAIWAPNRWEWVVAACGAWYVGAAVVPISVRSKSAEAAEVLERTGAAVLAFGGEEARARVARLGDLLHVIQVVDLDEIASLLAGDELPSGAPRPTGDDDCQILFTSGTTGEPKGVRLSHRQVLDNYWAYGLAAGFREGDRYLVVVPFGHGGGLNGCTTTCLIHGITNLPVERFEPAAALDLIERERVTIVMGPPQLFRQIFGSPTLAAHDTSSLRITITGSAITPPELIEELRGRGIGRVINAYGLIEGSAVSMTREGDPDDIVSTTVGRPLPRTELRVVDDGLVDVPTGTVGEVLVRGPGVMQGYLDAPALTAAAITGGWLRTGDAGTLDEAGHLRIVDRKKEMYIVAGFNVYPAEVERCLTRHPDVDAVTVVAVRRPDGGESGHAFVVARPRRHLGELDVRAWAGEHLADYKVPRSVSFLDELPLNATGKVDRKALRAAAQDLVSER